MTIDGRLNVDKFIELLERLINNAENLRYLIVDEHPTHKASKVNKSVDSTNGGLKLFYQSAYSSELNPDEHVWNHVKNHNIGKRTIAGPDHLKKLVISALRSLQKLPSTIRGFFRDPHLSYIPG